MSYWETALVAPLAADGVPGLPAYTVSALSKPTLLNPAGAVMTSGHSTLGWPGPFGPGAARAPVAAATWIPPARNRATRNRFIVEPPWEERSYLFQRRSASFYSQGG